MILLLCLANCVLLSLTFCRSLMVGWSRGRLHLKKGMMMRTSPCWIHSRFDLLWVRSNHQLGLHVRDLVLFTFSPCAPTPSDDIIARTSSSPAYNHFLQVRLLGASIDYYLKLDRLLEQLVRLLPTTSMSHPVLRTKPNA
jgi:hypothetical protein